MYSISHLPKELLENRVAQRSTFQFAHQFKNVFEGVCGTEQVCLQLTEEAFQLLTVTVKIKHVKYNARSCTD